MSIFMAELARPEPSRLYRWAVLLFVSLAMGGNYYIYDSINPLERIFIDNAALLCHGIRVVERVLQRGCGGDSAHRRHHY